MMKLYTVLQFEDDSRAYVETTRFVESQGTDECEQRCVYCTSIGSEVGKLNTFEWGNSESEALENHKLAIDLMVTDCEGDCGECGCDCGEMVLDEDEPVEFCPEFEVSAPTDEEVELREYDKVAPKSETADPEEEEVKEEETPKRAKTVDDIITLLSKTGVKNMDFNTNSTMIDGVYTNTIYGDIDGDKFESVMEWNHNKNEASIVMKINDEVALKMEGSIDELREDIFKVAKALLETR